MGAEGYPLLLQTGETADGIMPLIDRQHPHDLLMELGVEYAVDISPNAAFFLYVAPVGAPAVGPTAFMHRASGHDNPVTPISHHFLDSTHIAHGVVTAGVLVNRRVQVEASLFNGREPDQDRWDVQPMRLDSWAFRGTVNPTANLSIQASMTELKVEQVHPGIDVVRMTTSATYNRPLRNGNWQTTVAFGRNKQQNTTIPLREARRTSSQPVLDHFIGQGGLPDVPEDQLRLLFPTRVSYGWFVELAAQLGRSTAFGRFEVTRKHEMFEPQDVRHSLAFTVSKLEVGGIFDVWRLNATRVGVGATGSLHRVPREIRADYGDGLMGWSLFMRLSL